MGQQLCGHHIKDLKIDTESQLDSNVDRVLYQMIPDYKIKGLRLPNITRKERNEPQQVSKLVLEGELRTSGLTVWPNIASKSLWADRGNTCLSWCQEDSSNRLLPAAHPCCLWPDLKLNSLEAKSVSVSVTTFNDSSSLMDECTWKMLDWVLIAVG